MATLLDTPVVVSGAHRFRPDALKLADEACRRAIAAAGLRADEIDLLLNAGLYHARCLGEPALAALIQEDVGINPEDPSPGRHSSFSFDVANGACGVLTALQVADGFLRSGVIEHAVVVASDANPGRRIAPELPFAPAAAAVVCGYEDGARGVVGFAWERGTDDGELFVSRVFSGGSGNRLRIEQHPDFGPRAAAWAGKAVARVLADRGLRPEDVDLVVANPLTESFLGSLPGHTGIDGRRIVSVEAGKRVHTAGLLVALAAAREQQLLGEAPRVLLVSAGAGIVAGAALLTR